MSQERKAASGEAVAGPLGFHFQEKKLHSKRTFVVFPRERKAWPEVRPGPEPSASHLALQRARKESCFL